MSTLTPMRRSDWSWSKCIENQSQELQILVVRYDEKKVLLLREEDRWVLPGSMIPLNTFESVYLPPYVIPVVHEILGEPLPLTLLRQIWRREKKATIDGMIVPVAKIVLLMECRESPVSFQEERLQWIPLQNAHVFHLIEDAEAAIQREVRISLSTTTRNRLAWQRPGWMAATSLWMEEVLLRKCNARLTEVITPLRSSEFGVILQAETTMGRFFLKCTAPDTNDASYTQALARIAPAYVAAPVTVDVSKQIMVTADYGEVLHTFHLSESEERQVTKDFVRLQMATIDKTEELIRASVPDFRVAKMLEHIDRLASCPVFKSLGNSETSKADVRHFCNNTEMFKEKLGRLLNSDIPSTITHNDLWNTNIYRSASAENFMFFDFVDSYVSHPFAACISGLNQECFLQEWGSRSREAPSELYELFNLGQSIQKLAMILLELQGGTISELPESEWFFDRARFHLTVFNFRLRQERNATPREFMEIILNEGSVS